MREVLEKQLAALSEEIRNYPTPIARCDLHLPALIEERSRVVAKLILLEEQGPCGPLSLWVNDGGSHAA